MPAIAFSQETALERNEASPEVVKLAPYVVTSAHSSQPGTVEIDPRAPAQPVPAHDGADILKSIPGFSVIRKGGTDGDPVLRGFAGSRVVVEVDGDCLYGGCGSRMDPPTAYVFPSAYDRVTVIKGPQTVLHGPGNAAGIVRFERETRRLPGPGWQGNTGFAFARFGRVDSVVDGTVGTPDFQARLTGTFTRSDDYADGSGTAVHSAYERWSANTTAAWTPDPRTSLEVTMARSDGEAAYADRMMDGVKFDRTGYGVRFKRDGLSPLVTRVEARWYRNYIDHVMDNFTLRPFVPSMMMPGRSVSNPDRLTAGGKMQVTLALGETVSLTAGGDTQANEHTLRSTTDEAARPYASQARTKDAEFSQVGAFAEGTWSIWPDLRLVSGGRLDFWRVEDRRTSVMVPMAGTLPNPSAGRVRRSDLLSGFIRMEHDVRGLSEGTTVFAGVGRAQRFPDYWELIKNESLGSVSAFGTRPETTSQLDCGVLWRGEKAEASVSLFASAVDDFILVESNVRKASGMMGQRSAVVTRNLRARTQGGEATLVLRPAPGWRGQVSVAYVRGENVTDSRPLAQMPPLEGRFSLAYATRTWTLGGLVRAVSEQDRVAVNQGNIVGQDIGPSSSFAVLSLNAGIALGDEGKLALGVDNVLDETYAEHISRAGSTVSGFTQTVRVNEPGRTYWLKLDWSF